MIYFAAPLFNERERAFNAEIVGKLEEFVPVFLPQRDGALLAEMLDAGVPLEVAQRRVFLQDCRAMRDATATVAILDGAHVDEGVAFEIGYTLAARKPCIGLQTDVRRSLASGNNPMIECALEQLCSSVDEVVLWAQRHAACTVSQVG